MNAAAGVIAAAMEQGRRTPAGMALALDSARLLQSPEKAAELVALRNDALNMRGVLSPNGFPRRVPMPLGKELTPVVEWLLNRIDELEAQTGTARAMHVRHADSEHCQYDDMRWPCPTVVALSEPGVEVSKDESGTTVSITSVRMPKAGGAS